jgi:hypothetical protein
MCILTTYQDSDGLGESGGETVERLAEVFHSETSGDRPEFQPGHGLEAAERGQVEALLAGARRHVLDDDAWNGGKHVFFVYK